MCSSYQKTLLPLYFSGRLLCPPQSNVDLTFNFVLPCLLVEQAVNSKEHIKIIIKLFIQYLHLFISLSITYLGVVALKELLTHCILPQKILKNFRKKIKKFCWQGTSYVSFIHFLINCVVFFIIITISFTMCYTHNLIIQDRLLFYHSHLS